MLGHLDGAEIEQLLRDQVVGRIGVCAEGRVYVVPTTYAYDGEYVYGHSAEGMKLRMMRAAPDVCFEVEQVENLGSWRSVIAWGRFEELRGEAMMPALRALMQKVMPMMADPSAHPTHGLHPTPAHQHDGAGVPASAFRIRLGEKTGRFERR